MTNPQELQELPDPEQEAPQGVDGCYSVCSCAEH